MNALDWTVIGLFLLVLYFLPTVIAGMRQRQFGAILALNLLLGWTFLGWVAALIWALTSSDKAVAATPPGQPAAPPPAWHEPAARPAAPQPPEPAQAQAPSGPTERQTEAITSRLRAKARARGLSEQKGDDEGPASQTAAGLAPVAVFLEYADASGQASARAITLRRLEEGANGLRIMAWCHMRRAPRRFLVERIVALTDLATGEVHDGPEAAEALLRAIAGTSEAAGTALVDAATVLAFIAAADDALVDAERDAAARALDVIARELKVAAPARDGLAARLPSLAPDGAAARQAAVRLAVQAKPLRLEIASAMRAVIAADGASHPRETAAAADMAKAMGIAEEMRSTPI